GGRGGGGGVWGGGGGGVHRTETRGVTKKRLEDIAEKATTIPEGFHIYRKLDRLMQARVDMVQGKMPLDWGCAEMLSFGSLMMEGTPVRLVGQDAQRGTFSHRQAAWHDQETGEVYIPLANLSEDQGVFTLVNTMLSEFALLGFEYGVSSAEPRQLTLWEAQFGDFANMAQPIVDHFISSSESKWQRMCGLVMLLPHGFEGQGPEHSSARLERYLALCAEDNMQVGYLTTPAQYFHILRRQMLRAFRKPLILMQPKSLLRHKGSTSPIADFYKGHFHPLLDDPDQPDPGGIKRLVFCSGKVFFDLNDGRVEREQDAVALVRIEELYPFPWDDVAAILEKYAQADEICWVQEEPQNMGSWDFVEPKIRKTLGDAKLVRYIGRRATASTATGIQSTHLAEQKAIVDTTLDLSS
ncbi:MAG: 2-oxoglutarate dehydrogenase E1 component, partial [bacterium]|nr:2-oxoglutarate dehydrogenase E1 component [bacterium]